MRGQRASYQGDRAESSLERNLVEHLSTLQTVLLRGLGSPEVPKGLPWGELEAGGRPGTPLIPQGSSPLALSRAFRFQPYNCR